MCCYDFSVAWVCEPDIKRCFHDVHVLGSQQARTCCDVGGHSHGFQRRVDIAPDGTIQAAIGLRVRRKSGALDLPDVENRAAQGRFIHVDAQARTRVGSNRSLPLSQRIKRG